MKKDSLVYRIEEEAGSTGKDQKKPILIGQTPRTKREGNWVRGQNFSCDNVHSLLTWDALKPTSLFCPLAQEAPGSPSPTSYK